MRHIFDRVREPLFLRPDLCLAGLLGVLVLAASSCTYSSKGFTGDPAPGALPWLVYPAKLELQVQQPAGTDWLLPGHAVPLGDVIYLLDTANDRLLKLGRDGSFLSAIDAEADPRINLRKPLALATDGERLAVANSDAAQLLLFDSEGLLQREIPLPALGPRALPARPIGVAILPDGGYAVSDANNHLVIFLNEDGEVTATAGSGVRSEGHDGFNVPGGLARDAVGNVYVVDTLNARVVKLSPDGEFLHQFSERGSNVGSLSRPKGVAVDREGRVFVSDGLLAAVQVFGADDEYLGLIGRVESDVPGEESPFRAPAGLWLDGDHLYVTDRFAGLLVYELGGS